MNLNANFVVSLCAASFNFSTAEDAAKFQKNLQKISGRAYARAAGIKTAQEVPAVGSTLDAYPVRPDGSVSEDKLTLATAESKFDLKEKKEKGERKPRTPRKPRGEAPTE